MEKNFFDLVNDGFFTVLTGKYKEINYQLLTLINKSMEQEGSQLERSRVIEIIQSYFQDMPNLKSFEYDINGNMVDFKKNPSELLRMYETSGWMSSEGTSDFKQVYQMEPAAIQILTAMDSAVKNDERPIESTGYVYSIYDTLKNFNIKNATATSEQLDIVSHNLSDNLRMINSKIRKYLNNLLKEDRQEPKKILAELLDTYQNNVVARSFNNLRQKDNPAKYKDEIIELINNLKYDHMDELVENYINVKLAGKFNEDNILEARVFFNEVFSNIRMQFETIAEKINKLDAKNTQYVASARSRVMFLLNDKENLEGKIDSILRLVEDKHIRNNEEFEFELYERGHIDDESLYSYTRSKKAAPTVVEEITSNVSQEEIDRYKHNIMRLSQFTIASVNKFILTQLGDKEYIQAKDFKLETFDQFMMLFLARIYSQDKGVDYLITSLDDTFKYEDRIIENFKITRRINK